MKNLRFSILIPTYNGESVIAKTLKSVLYQDYKNYEIIINDDSSSDKTVQIIRSFKDKRIKLYLNKNNLGYPGNLNKCLDRATGDIIYLLGQDDILSVDALTSAYKAFQLSPDIGAVTRPYRWFDEDLNTTVRARLPLNPLKDEVVKITDSPERVVSVFKTLDSLSALAYRAKFIDRPFHPDIFPCHVYPFASIFKKHPVVFLKNYVSSVSMDNSQCRFVSSIYDKSPLLCWVQMFQNIFPEKKFDNMRNFAIKNFVAANYVGLAQIKNYSRHSHLYTAREIYFLITYRLKNLLNPAFWFFSIGAFITPPFLLIKMVDWYKKNINTSIFKNIEFKHKFRTTAFL